MGRHSLHDVSGAPGTGASAPRTSVRRRAVIVSTALALLVGAGTAVAAQGGWLPFGEDCDGKTVALSVAASPDIAPTLRAAADRAQRDDVKSDGRCLVVTVKERTGAEMADRLRRGDGAQGHQVWLPDSALWVQRAGNSGKAPPMETLGNVTTSPVALAAVPAAAKSLGWPEKTYTWSDLATAAAEGREAQLGAADPVRSATGLLALTHIGRSISKDGGKDAETRTAATAKLLSERTTPEDAQLAATLPRDESRGELGNPQRNHALVMSEQAAYAHNTGEHDAPRLQLFYPDDGLVLLDYPYTLLDEEKLTTEQIRAATRFLTLLGDEEGRRTLLKQGFRTTIGTPDTGLVRKAGGRAPQPYSETAADPPPAAELEAALGIWTIIVQSERLTTVVDASGSMAAPVPGQEGRSRMDVVKAALHQALTHFTPDDEIGLWEFARRLDGERDHRILVPTARLADRTDRGRTQLQELTAALSTVEPVRNGATGLYDTALAAYQDAHEKYDADKFNVVVILTDGGNVDPGSIGRGALVKELKKLKDSERPLPLIAIAIGPDADIEACEDIAEATGGSGYEVSDPEQIFEVIFKAIVAASKDASS